MKREEVKNETWLHILGVEDEKDDFTIKKIKVKSREEVAKREDQF